MSLEPAIVVEGLGKRFRRKVDRPSTLKETILRGLRRTPAEFFWGLSDVSLQVERGSMLGVLGHNGAGKSTLLRLIGGVGSPDQGTIRTRGRIGALLELGAGFHPDLSGRENGVLASVIAGLSRREAEARFADIVSFAELHAFIDAPLRTYSSGMVLRLAFSVAVHTDTDILLVDEVLAVGDLAFQRKCIRRIQELKAAGTTIVLVTHDTSQVRKYCDAALWLDHGKVAGYGATGSVTDAYTAEMAKVTQALTPTERAAETLASGMELSLGKNRFGSLELEIADVRLKDRHGVQLDELDSGELLRIELELRSDRAIESPIVNLAIVGHDGQVYLDSNTSQAPVDLGVVDGKRRLSLVIERLDLVGGDYFVEVGAYERSWSHAYDEHNRVYPLCIRATPATSGSLAPPQRWEVDEPETGAQPLPLKIAR